MGRDSLSVAGGWYVSNNALMTSKTCTAKPEWNGYSCPYFGEGFVQLVIQDPKADLTDHTGLNGTDFTAVYKDLREAKGYSGILENGSLWTIPWLR